MHALWQASFASSHSQFLLRSQGKRVGVCNFLYIDDWNANLINTYIGLVSLFRQTRFRCVLQASFLGLYISQRCLWSVPALAGTSLAPLEGLKALYSFPSSSVSW